MIPGSLVQQLGGGYRSRSIHCSSPGAAPSPLQQRQLAPAAGTHASCCSCITGISVFSMRSLAEPRQPSAGLKRSDAVALAGLLGQRGFGQRLAGRGRGRRSSGCGARCCRTADAAAHAEDLLQHVKFICRNQLCRFRWWEVGCSFLLTADVGNRMLRFCFCFSFLVFG